LKKKKNILVCPLDWGLGHASRCVPLIRLMVEKDFNVIIGADGRSASFLRNEFPDLKHIHIKCYDIRFPSNGNMTFKVFRQIPALINAFKAEHRLLDQLIDEYKIDAVISDNRFAMWSKKVPSIYITHQVTIKAPACCRWTESLLTKIHHGYIKHFDECWIPDTHGSNNISEELAHKRATPVPAYFIGPLSRFRPVKNDGRAKKYDLMFVVSGPEPQRSIFEKMVLEQLEGTDYKALIVTGKTELSIQALTEGKVDIHTHMNSEEMQDALLSSELVIGRPGYSSLMDLAVLGLKAAFVPTPGQTEQEYLARLHNKKGNYAYQSQKDFKLEKLIHAASDTNGIKMDQDYSVLNQCIDRLKTRIDRL